MSTLDSNIFGKKKFSDILNEINIPVLECSSGSDDYKEKCLNFYNSFTTNYAENNFLYPCRSCHPRANRYFTISNL